MPKISETDWELIENNVCAISFLQGLNIGSKKYNGYAVVPNALSKEYVSENDIYILAKDVPTNTYIYYKPNDSTINASNIQQKNGTTNYYAGIWKIGFEEKTCIGDDNEKHKYLPNKNLGSYTSIMGSSGITDIITNGMYNFMRTSSNTELKKTFYHALARERWGAYHVNNNLDLQYFLDSY